MDIYERFMSHVDTSGGPHACHPWTASLFDDGYGKFWADGKSRRASRWLLGHLRGHELTAEEWALHHCDNRPCVNNVHLYIGDHVQNIRDRSERGRASRQGSPLSVANAAKTHCPLGHEYDRVNCNGYRRCRTCERAAETRYRARKAVAA